MKSNIPFLITCLSPPILITTPLPILPPSSLLCPPHSILECLIFLQHGWKVYTSVQGDDGAVRWKLTLHQPLLMQLVEVRQEVQGQASFLGSATPQHPGQAGVWVCPQVHHQICLAVCEGRQLPVPFAHHLRDSITQSNNNFGGINRLLSPRLPPVTTSASVKCITVINH